MENLIKRGAEARAQGLSFIDNPYFAPDALPVATGETPEEWSRKAEAWNAGWKLEDAVRHA